MISNFFGRSLRRQGRRRLPSPASAAATVGCIHSSPTSSATSTLLRTFAIYAVGEGWTGAMTQRYLQQTVPGHFDEDLHMDNNNNTNSLLSTNHDASAPTHKSSSLPVMIYPHDDHDDDAAIQQVAVGWGTTALVDTQGRVKMVGRPHDVMTLLRMNRMPTMIRNWIVARQLQQQQQQQGNNNNNNNVEAVTPVGSAISNLIGWATGAPTEKDVESSSIINEWEQAKKYSYLADWTYIENGSVGPIQQIACGPGIVAMIEKEGGTLYSMGVNNRGQCGVGTISNNVWTPHPVRGLTTNKKNKKASTLESKLRTEQDQPMIQVALGFQHGYALSKEGQVYSWGKAQRGQLGRNVDYDQDPWAGPIVMDEKVVQISAGHHHGALLTEHGTVYVWGKNMGRNKKNGDDNDNDNKPRDALFPEPVVGLPTNAAKVQQISCGSHHTAMLLQDGSVYAIGIASDEALPILEAVELVPAGVIEMPVRQFEAHHDRTTIVDKSGTVLQAHLWLDDTLREYAYFTPSYLDALLDNEVGEGANPLSVRSIHRGWRHTIIVTDGAR